MTRHVNDHMTPAHLEELWFCPDKHGKVYDGLLGESSCTVIPTTHTPDLSHQLRRWEGSGGEGLQSRDYHVT